MKRIVLFSNPTETNIDQLTEVLFPLEMPGKVLAYLPSNGSQSNPVYTDYWMRIASKRETKFTFVDNLLSESAGEAKKIIEANILLITGGNTFGLLNNLRQSKLDQMVKEFAKKNQFILGGFSAGAIVLSPTIEAANVPSGNDPNDIVDQNSVGITDLTGLNIIDFEIMPHYEDNLDNQTLENYRKQTNNKVREITNEGIVVLDM